MIRVKLDFSPYGDSYLVSTINGNYLGMISGLEKGYLIVGED